MAKTSSDMQAAVAADATALLSVLRAVIAALRALAPAHPMAERMLAAPLAEAERHFRALEEKVLNG